MNFKKRFLSGRNLKTISHQGGRMTFKKLTLGLFIMFSVVFVSGCSVTQGTIEKRGEVLGQRPADSNFLEARQIGDVEDWKDLKGKIVNVYLINPATGNLLVPPVQ